MPWVILTLISMLKHDKPCNKNLVFFPHPHVLTTAPLSEPSPTAMNTTEISVSHPPSPGQLCLYAHSSRSQQARVSWLTPEALTCHCSHGEVQQSLDAWWHRRKAKPGHHPADQHERQRAVPSAAAAATGGARPLLSGLSGQGLPCTHGFSSRHLHGHRHKGTAGGGRPSPPAAPRICPAERGLWARGAPAGSAAVRLPRRIAVPGVPYHTRASRKHPRALLCLSAPCCFSPPQGGTRGPASGSSRQKTPCEDQQVAATAEQSPYLYRLLLMCRAALNSLLLRASRDQELPAHSRSPIVRAAQPPQALSAFPA